MASLVAFVVASEVRNIVLGIVVHIVWHTMVDKKPLAFVVEVVEPVDNIVEDIQLGMTVVGIVARIAVEVVALE